MKSPLEQSNMPEWIKKQREQAGLSQKELARKLGVSQPQISLWENGVSRPSRDTVRKMSAILGVDVESPALSSDFGEWLRRKREEKGYSRSQLAKESGVSSLAIYFIETGKTESPQERTLSKLVRVLGPLPPSIRKEIEEERRIENLEFLGPFPVENWREYVDQAGISAIYVFYDQLKRPVRIGETDDLKRRLKEYSRDAWWFRSPTVESFAYVVVKDADFRKKTEKLMIKLVGEHAIFNIQERI